MGNVAGLGGSGSTGASGAHRRSSASGPSKRPSANSDGGMRVPTPNGGEVLLTRRHFLFGALGVGALAALGGGAGAVMQQIEKDSADDLVVLEVPESAVTSSDALTLVEDHSTRMSLVGNFELPYGSLVWANDDDFAACLLPNEGARPLTSVAMLALGSGNLVDVLDGAVGLADGFEIYDVRGTSSGLIWTEADILDGIWHIYTARFDGGALGEPALVDEGDSDWETPSIAIAGNRAFWQVLPVADGPRRTEDSLLKRATVGSTEAEVVYTSHGRMATPPYALEDAVVITPRTDTGSIHYQLTCIDAASGDVRDTMVLPTSMRPLEAGYGKTGFSFSFDAIYNYGGGIANLGTYTPMNKVADGNYSGAPWFCFGRTPTAAPAWCGDYFMVKSRSAVCGVNFANNEYFSFDVENGADTYGEYLASSGTHGTAVTFANIDHKPLDGEAIKLCRVRVWSPLT